MHIPPFSTTNSTTCSTEELLYQLQVYQIELEMQNENLRQSYDALAELEQDYLELYEFAPVGYLTLSNQGLIEKSNLTAATLLGESCSQLLQRRFAGFINTTDMDRWHLFFAQVMRGNQQKTIEIALKQPNDNWLYAKLHCRPVLKAGKQPTLWIALTDITESKQAAEMGITANIELVFQNKEKEKRATELSIANIELAFQNTEKENRAAEAVELVIANKEMLIAKNKLQIITDLMPIAVFVKDTQYRIILMNKACEAKWGLSFSQLENTTGSQFFPPEQMTTFLAGDKQAFTDDKLHETENFVWNSQLQVNRIHHSYKQAVFSESGQPLYLIGVSEDITERKQMEKYLQDSESKFRALYDSSTDAIMLGIPMFFDCNQAALTLFGCKTIAELCTYHPSDLSPLEQPCGTSSLILEQQYIATAYKRGKFRFEWTHKKIDTGEIFIAEVLLTALILNEKSVLQATVHDITERKHAEMELRIAAKVFESQEGMFITNIDWAIIKVNHAFTEITGYSAADAIGQTPRLLNSGRHDKDFYQKVWQTINETDVWRGEIWNRRKNGEIYPEQETITAVRASKDNQITHYVASFTDITERKAAEEKIKQLAFYDPLTGLPNRRKLLDRLHYSISINHRTNSQFAVFMMDLDKFKAVNDKLGHAAGDELLKQVAARITNCLRDSDMVARLGGDEFVLVLENLKIPEAAEIIALKVIAELTVPFQLSSNNTVQIGASIGISLYPQHGNTSETLMDHADSALYQAKDNGRGCFAYFSGNG